MAEVADENKPAAEGADGGAGGMSLGMGEEDKEDNKIESAELQFLFSQTRDQFPAKPHNEDGNPDFYSEDNEKKREQLKTNPVVEEAINDFIESMFPHAKDAEDVIPREQYIT